MRTTATGTLVGASSQQEVTMVRMTMMVGMAATGSSPRDVDVEDGAMVPPEAQVACTPAAMVTVAGNDRCAREMKTRGSTMKAT